MDFYDLIMILRKEGLEWTEIYEEFRTALLNAQLEDEDDEEDE